MICSLRRSYRQEGHIPTAVLRCWIKPLTALDNLLPHIKYDTPLSPPRQALALLISKLARPMFTIFSPAVGEESTAPRPSNQVSICPFFSFETDAAAFHAHSPQLTRQRPNFGCFQAPPPYIKTMTFPPPAFFFPLYCLIGNNFERNSPFVCPCHQKDETMFTWINWI